MGRQEKSSKLLTKIQLEFPFGWLRFSVLSTADPNPPNRHSSFKHFQVRIVLKFGRKAADEIVQVLAFGQPSPIESAIHVDSGKGSLEELG